MDTPIADRAFKGGSRRMKRGGACIFVCYICSQVSFWPCEKVCNIFWLPAAECIDYFCRLYSAVQFPHRLGWRDLELLCRVAEFYREPANIAPHSRPEQAHNWNKVVGLWHTE